MTVSTFFLATLVTATSALGQTTPSSQQSQVPDEDARESSEDEISAVEAASTGFGDVVAPPPPPPKPPDGLLPVAELARVELTPSDRPKALLYGTHLLVVGRSGFVEGHDADSGEFRWKLGLPGEVLFDPVVFEAGPLVDGETDAFTVVLSEPSGHVLLVDGLTGEIRKEARLPFELALPPIRGSKDIVFFATPSGDVVGYDVRSEQVVFQTATGETPMALASTETLLVVSGGSQNLTALNLPAGTLRWTFRGRAGFHAPAAFDPDGTRVYVGDDTGELYALDARDGSVKFRWSTGAAIRARALVEGKRLYLATWANTLYAFNATTGDEHWRANLPGRPATAPMRVRNRLIVATYDGVLIEVDPARGRPGKQYVAPGEIVFAPSFFVAQPSPEELALAANVITVPGAQADVEEDDAFSELDPAIFGPEEIDPSETPESSAFEDPDTFPDTVDDASENAPDVDANVLVELPTEPAWFERSRIAMALRSGVVLLLGHQVPRAAPADPDSGENPASGDGEADETERPPRPPTSPSGPRR